MGTILRGAALLAVAIPVAMAACTHPDIKESPTSASPGPPETTGPNSGSGPGSGPGSGLGSGSGPGSGLGSGSGPGSGSGSGSGDAQPGTVALRIREYPGLTMADKVAAGLPQVTVYTDGRLIDEDARVTIGGPPALRNVQLRRISVADVQKLVDRAVDAGVGKAGHAFGRPPITDATTTRFTVRAPEGVRTTEVYALAEAIDTGLTPEQRNARRNLAELVRALADLPGTLGARAVGEPVPYPAAAVAAFAAPCGSPPPGGSVDPCAGASADPRPWPGAPLPGEPVASVTTVTCAVTSGAAAEEVLGQARTALTTTSWTYGGSRWRVDLRPLLPDESGCDDLLPPR